jgi:hypothetical protein
MLSSGETLRGVEAITFAMVASSVDKGKNDQDVVSFPDLIPYMGGTISSDDVCPSLGTYSLTTVGTKPTCDIQSEAFPHAVPE